MNYSNKKLSLTVGIPTCYGGWSLVETARTIRASKGTGDFRFIVVADRTPLSSEVKRELKKLKVELHWNDSEGSQNKKLKQMVEKLNTDIFIYTQDDITFLPDTILNIITFFKQNPEITMTGARILPLSPITFFEHVMATGVSIVDTMSHNWKNGNNYLASSGRCLGFRVSQIKKYRIPEQVINGDMYHYLENRRLGGRFKQCPSAKVYIRCPQRFKDQVGPSSRFQIQKEELQQYFNWDISSEYKIPFHIYLVAILQESFHNHIFVPLYFGLYFLTRIFKQSKKIVTDPVWKVDPSTKNI